MTKQKDKKKKEGTEFLNKSIKESKEFFNKPKKLDILIDTGIIVLKKIQSELLKNTTDDEVNNFVKNNRELQKIISCVTKDLNEDIISDIVLACGNPDFYPNQINKLTNIISRNGDLSGLDFINIINIDSDFNSKTDNFNINETFEKIKDALPIIYLVYYISLKIKEFLTQNKFPSPFRGKYLQKLIRIVGTIIKKTIKNLGIEIKKIAKEAIEIINSVKSLIKSIQNLLKTLKLLDSVIIATLAGAFIYLNNRKKAHQHSFDTFNEISKPMICEPLKHAKTNEEIQINSVPFNINNLSCPIEINEPLVPHEPFENKLANVSCEYEGINQIVEIEEGDLSNIDTKAIINNDSSINFNILVSNNDNINSRTILGTFGDTRVYSPINGIISSISDNKIYIDDARDPEESYLDELINESKTLQEELNNIKFFIKDYYIKSWYPVLLSKGMNGTLGGKAINFYFIRATINTALINKSYEKQITNIAGEDNVKKNAENETLDKIKTSIDKEEKIYYDTLLEIINTAEKSSSVSLKNEVSLIEYYFNLYQDLISYWNKDTNMVKTFSKEINKILIERFFVDEWNLSNIVDRINELGDELTIFFIFNKFKFSGKKIFSDLLIQYNINNDIKTVESYLKELSKNAVGSTDYEKETVINKIVFNFLLYLQINVLIKETYITEYTVEQVLKIESTFINSFFNNLWKKFEEIPIKLDDIYKKIDDISSIFSTYSIINEDQEQYRFYGIGKKRNCPIPIENEDGYLSPFSEYEYNDIEYWQKYCSYATLMSVAGKGWATGLPPLIGPIPFPIIYIPIKGIQLQWGIIAMGLSICGIYVYPWVLYVNYDLNYQSSIGNPTKPIKKAIDNLKKDITKQLKEFKTVSLKKYLDDIKEKVDIVDIEINKLEEEKRLHKLEKPTKDRTPRDKSEKESKAKHISKQANYIKKLAKWNEKQVNYVSKILELKTSKYVLNIKYKIIYDVYSGTSKVKDSNDNSIKTIKQNEEKIDKLFKKLNKLEESINPFLEPLPISLEPNSTNFGFTVKNPKIIIKFDENIDDNINTDVVKKIIDKFTLKSKDLMSSNINSKFEKLNWEKYKKTLKASIPIIIKKEPFPKYKNLKPTNLAWTNFLVKDWVPTGAKTYGIPGFP